MCRGAGQASAWSCARLVKASREASTASASPPRAAVGCGSLDAAAGHASAAPWGTCSALPPTSMGVLRCALLMFWWLGVQLRVVVEVEGGVNVEAARCFSVPCPLLLCPVVRAQCHRRRLVPDLQGSLVCLEQHSGVQPGDFLVFAVGGFQGADPGGAGLCSGSYFAISDPDAGGDQVLVETVREEFASPGWHRRTSSGILWFAMHGTIHLTRLEYSGCRIIPMLCCSSLASILLMCVSILEPNGDHPRKHAGHRCC